MFFLGIDLGRSWMELTAFNSVKRIAKNAVMLTDFEMQTARSKSEKNLSTNYQSENTNYTKIRLVNSDSHLQLQAGRLR
ncbi:hypothetical protein EV144_107263 [Flavobacterium sp. 270]|uniref:hypothetical protein n=1 Tax=Flavobacterium sp. 270 TaxID=2512114 RepID=UPI0010655F8C|nr:hypothetical protein [Flavobacterium sp. 270]TDW46069.1 hypothetical protein EV144_107263 [Flavobacterium sp. 270]